MTQTLRRELKQKMESVITTSDVWNSACCNWEAKENIYGGEYLKRLLDDLADAALSVAGIAKRELPKSMDWLLASGASAEEMAAQNEQANAEKTLLDLYESEMKYGALDWHGKDLDRLRRFLVKQTPQAIRDFAAWSKRPYSTFDPSKARLKPDMVIDLWTQAVKPAMQEPQEKRTDGKGFYA